ncbi:MAG: DivIVA domain-containing protein [Candidatus Cloacimonadia bacterium]
METQFSPAKIRSKEFAKAARGYNKKEVKDFLDKIAQQTQSLENRIAELEKELETQGERLRNLEEQKELVDRILLVAEKIKDESIASAKQEAENIIKEAELAAKEEVKKAKDYLCILEHDFINMKEQRKVFISQLKSQLHAMLDMVDMMQKKDREMKPSTSESAGDKETDEKETDILQNSNSEEQK